MTFSISSFLHGADTKANVKWEIKSYSKGDTIVEEGSEGSEVFLINSGIVHILASISATEINKPENKGLAKLSADHIFGELAIFDKQSRSATAIAASDCEIYVINGTELLSYMNANPAQGYPVLLYLFEQIVQRMRENNIRTTTVMGFYLREQTE